MAIGRLGTTEVQPEGTSINLFDAGFNPRFEKYAVRAYKLGPGDYVSSSLSTQPAAYRDLKLLSDSESR